MLSWSSCFFSTMKPPSTSNVGTVLALYHLSHTGRKLSSRSGGAPAIRNCSSISSAAAMAMELWMDPGVALHRLVAAMAMDAGKDRR